MKITILGGGTWGTALAQVLSKNYEVTVWCRSGDFAEELRTTRCHKNLPGLVLADSIEFTPDFDSAVRGCMMVFLAVPSPAVRTTAARLRTVLESDGQIVVCVSKGLEPGTLCTMSEILHEELGAVQPVVVLSGPTHAEEVALEMPTLIVAASENEAAACEVQNLFAGTCLRPYTNGDIRGVEVCGALKNIIALACGIAEGLGFGDNTRAALMTRGMAEIRCIGLALGCLEETFSGLSGIGDLIVTATSRHSRNNRCGHYIGEGLSPQEAIQKVGMTVEGVNALPAAVSIADKYHLPSPIIRAVHAIVNEGVPAGDMVDRLFYRNLHSELSRSVGDLRTERALLNQHRQKNTGE